MVMHWNEFYEENEMIEDLSSTAIKVVKRFFNQNYISFHSYYRGLLSPTKWAVRDKSMSEDISYGMKLLLTYDLSLEH